MQPMDLFSVRVTCRVRVRVRVRVKVRVRGRGNAIVRVVVRARARARVSAAIQGPGFGMQAFIGRLQDTKIVFLLAVSTVTYTFIASGLVRFWLEAGLAGWQRMGEMAPFPTFCHRLRVAVWCHAAYKLID